MEKILNAVHAQKIKWTRQMMLAWAKHNKMKTKTKTKSKTKRLEHPRVQLRVPWLDIRNKGVTFWVDRRKTHRWQEYLGYGYQRKEHHESKLEIKELCSIWDNLGGVSLRHCVSSVQKGHWRGRQGQAQGECVLCPEWETTQKAALRCWESTGSMLWNYSLGRCWKIKLGLCEWWNYKEKSRW